MAASTPAPARSPGRSAARSGPGFALAAIVAAFTAASYAELVSKYPQAAGAALYIHRAFKAPLLTFVVAFAVMSSGLASPPRSRSRSAATT